MLCDICHKHDATIHLTEIVNEKVTEMHICSSCAKKKAHELKEQLSIADLVGGLASMTGGHKEETALKCPGCGLTYTDFRKKGRLGCAQCYTTFRQQLMPLLKRIHSSSHHTGKFPLRMVSSLASEAKSKELRDRLHRAIQLEDYEEAARLRDEMRKLGEGEKLR
ncbi:MAG: UvrB/UvrC motif-containing protein [Candidatus Omnitrophota bacterium]